MKKKRDSAVRSSGMVRRRLGGHGKIARAYRENRGAWLTPEDIEDLMHDQAIKDLIEENGRGFDPSPNDPSSPTQGGSR